MRRRKFIKTTGYTATAACIGPLLGGNIADEAKIFHPVYPDKQISVEVKDNKVYIETQTLTAVIDKGVLTTLKSKLNGEEFIENPDITNFRALQLLYVNNEVIEVNEEKFGRIETHQISGQRAEIIFHSWDGDGVLSISVDAETGDLLIEPSAYSSRPGCVGMPLEYFRNKKRS